jgi:hypothetical protein
MKIELNKNTNLKWEDLNYGDVFIVEGDVCMKVGFIYDGEDNKVEYVLDLQSGELFDDIEMYEIKEVVECKLVRDNYED